jgi:hypothetical protein
MALWGVSGEWGNHIYLSLLKCPEERMVREVSKSPLHEYWFA